MKPGKVYIVGAGPGAADLLTVRAASVLKAASVVLHDDLVPGEILGLASTRARKINVGKRCGERGVTQERINQLMISHARRGQDVVRLKAGDPAVFGRLGEEIEALRSAEVFFEVVPGVTAATAAASAAALTLTDRRAASALVVLTAHSCRGRSLHRALLDPAQTTFAIYMPGPDYAATANELAQLGLEESTPCALVSRACRADQEVRFLSLAELRSTAAAAAPAVLIVGEVARTGDPIESPLFLEKINESFGAAFTNPAYQ